MKQISLALFLIFISTFTCKSLKSTNSLKIKSNSVAEPSTETEEDNSIGHITWDRLGNRKIRDIGGACDNTWVCTDIDETNTETEILKVSESTVNLSVTNKLEGQCKFIDSDSNGYPVVVTVIGDKNYVFRLKPIVKDSVIWEKIDVEGKILDIGSKSDSSIQGIFISIEGKNCVYMLEKNTFIESTYCAGAQINRLDVGSGNGGTKIIASVGEQNAVAELFSDKNPNSLGMIAKDVTFDCSNVLFVNNDYGVYYKSKCSLFFYHIHDILGERISTGNGRVYLTGSDKYLYRGKLKNYVNDC